MIKKNICICIFARKGSKGVKNKNIKKINNKMLFEYSLKYAKMLNVGKIVVSSNINQIKNYCKTKNIFFIKRPNKLSTSTSAELLSWKHAIREYEKLKKNKVDIFVSLPVVSPLKHINYIKKGIEIIKKNNFDLVVSTIKSDVIPNFNLFKKKGDKLYPFKSIKKTFRRQSSNYNLVIPNFYICKKEYILSTKHIFDGKIYPLEIPKKYSLDINDNFDFKLTKLFIENK